MACAIYRLGVLWVALTVLGSGCSESEDAPSRDDDDTDGSVTEDTNDASFDEGVTVRGDCGGSSVADLCAQFCETFCQNQERLCVESECLPDDCDEGGLVYETCAGRCTDADCARDLCELQQGVVCEAFGVELSSGVFESMCLGSDPSCVLAPSFGCSDVCGSAEQVGGDLANNGLCEDGKADSVSAACTRGSDCTDCGPRVCAEAGSPCLNHGDCCGFYELGALCVDADGESGSMPPSCFPSCDDTSPCPEGFRCNPTSGGQDVCVEEP